MLIAAALAAALAAGAQASQARASELELRAIRFWVPENKLTQVLAMVDVPYSMATPIGTGPEAYLFYSVTVKVSDEKGNVLATTVWPRRVPAGLRVPGATGMEQLVFKVPQGVYRIGVTARDSASGRTMTDSINVDGYGSSPAVSDMIVASEMRIVPPEDTASAAGEISHGSFRFISEPILRIDPSRPNLAYLLEVYTPNAETSNLSLKIRAAGGTGEIALPVLPQKIPAGGGVLKGQFPLDGLPSGAYTLHASVQIGGQTIERIAPFVVTEAEAALARSVQITQQSRGLDEMYFKSLPEDSLDAAAEVLSLLVGRNNISSRSLAAYSRDKLTLTAKRTFLINFWAPLDENKATPQNETRINFYAKIAYAQANFGERGVPGWKTHRGRIFTRYGNPTDSISVPSSGQAPSYLIWQYRERRPLWFVFVDRSKNGQYVMVKTNATGESSNAAPLIEIMQSRQAAEDIAIYLGLDRNYFITGAGGAGLMAPRTTGDSIMQQQ